ncbi:MAG: hypothetical protein ABJB97_03780, partial [Acidobacteriota bacterium]
MQVMEPEVLAESEQNQTAELRLRERVRFPVPSASPFISVSTGNYLHLLTLAESRQNAQCFSLDDDGGVVGRVSNLPLTHIEGIAAAGNNLIVTGREKVEGNPWVFQLNARAETIWQSEIPIDGPLMTLPKIARARERFF